MAREFVFDKPHAMKGVEARQEPLREMLPFLKRELGLQTALDAGCGIGHFSSFLFRQGFRVFAFDARQANVEEASRRHHEITFCTADIEDASVLKLGSFDLVLCFGLVYHLENPFRAIRHLHALTKGVLLLESICVPGQAPIMRLRQEQPIEDQSLTPVAFYPSEPCLIKMCYQAGFGYVYRVASLPDHPEFKSSFDRQRLRTMLVTSNSCLRFPTLAYIAEPHDATDPWAKRTFAPRAVRFVRKPLREKARSLAFRTLRWFPRIVLPIRLPFGGWWLLRNDACGHAILAGTFENEERRFVGEFLQTGMTVLDIGAHHGYYTLLASKKVGQWGRVIAFEPSPRERAFLWKHLRLNRCKNVIVEGFALGSSSGKAGLYVVDGTETGCNSLRPPNVAEPTKTVPVYTSTLDHYLEQAGIDQIDFIKLDAEGGELEILRGAECLLRRVPRPVILAEVQDIRTQPWGYDAREVISSLIERGFAWHRLLPGGGLVKMPKIEERYDGNFLAIPCEKLGTFGIADQDGTSPGLTAHRAEALHANHGI